MKNGKVDDESVLEYLVYTMDTENTSDHIDEFASHLVDIEKYSSQEMEDFFSGIKKRFHSIRNQYQAGKLDSKEIAQKVKSVDMLAQDKLLDGLLCYLTSSDSTYKALYERGKQLEDLDEIPATMAGFQADKAMVQLDASLDYKAKLEKYLEIEKQVDAYRNIIFSHLVTTQWNKETISKYQRLIASPTVDTTTRALMLSALTISCSTVFDIKKFSALLALAICETSVTLKVRALVGVVICTIRVPLFYEKRVLEKLKEAQSEDSSFIKHILVVSKMLLRVLDTREASKAMHEHMINELQGMATRIVGQDQENDELSDDEENDDSAIDGILEMVKGGSDFYYDQFKKAKKFAFFHSMYNWFVPFYVGSTTCLKMQKSLSEDYGFRLECFMDNISMCDNDRYSLLLAFGEEDGIVQSILKNAPQELLDIYRKKQARKNGDDEYYIEWDEANPDSYMLPMAYYVQDIVRFYKLAPMRSSFFNPFDVQDTDYVFTPLLAPVYADKSFDKARLSMARYCVKRNELDYVEELLGDDYPDTIECHYMLAAMYCSFGERNTAPAIPHVERLLQAAPDNKVFVELAVEVYNYDQCYDKSIECLEKFLQCVDNKEEQDRAKKLLAHTYVLQNAYENASKLYYELWYNNSEDGWYLVHLVESLIYAQTCTEETLSKSLNMLHEFIKNIEEQSNKNIDFSKLNDKDPVKVMANLFQMMTNVKKQDHDLESRLHVLQGMILMALGEREDALKSFYTGYEVLVGFKKISKLDKPIRKDIFSEEDKAWLVAKGFCMEELSLINDLAAIQFFDFVSDIHREMKAIDESDAQSGAADDSNESGNNDSDASENKSNNE